MRRREAAGGAIVSRLTYAWVTALTTLLRLLPFPARTGLVRVGDPGRDSPVLLTSNFRLTVERVKRALKGIDAYLLVANGHGVNAWCASTGGLLTNHDVVSALKTSGIDELVDHRQLILPQLAATGIEGHVVDEKTGWRVAWGPVEASDVPAFLDGGLEATPPMRAVGFPWRRRLEMAVAWAFPISLLTLVVLPFWSEGVLPLMGFVWALSLLIFLGFPLYEGRLRTAGKHAGFILFDLGRHGLPVLMWLCLLLLGLGVAALLGELSLRLGLGLGVGSLAILLILSLDLTGSTPTYKSGLHADRLLAITLDEELCDGVGLCVQVCPKGVFELDADRRLARLSGSPECVQCGACIVQCPRDALCFTDPGGGVVTPEVVREFKLNLIGSRTRRQGSPST